MANTCTPQVINGQSCVVCTGQPYVAPVPARTETDPQLGWNASAYSRARHAGDCFTQFYVPDCVGMVLGLASERSSHSPSGVAHGFYVFRSAGKTYYQVQEAGQAKTARAAHVPAVTKYRIERRGTAVWYFVDDKRVHVSSTPSRGSVVVVACMYSAGDGAY